MEMQGGKMEKDFVLQWGNRKRLRCFNKLKKQHQHQFGNSGGGTSTTPHSLPLPNKKMGSSPVANRLKMNSDLGTNKSRSALTSPEKEDRYYATRGSGSIVLEDNNTKVLMDHHHVKEDKGTVWPRLFTTLSNKEKEQDFMAMKGCKLPQRPKKRAKLIQRSILLVSPGTWLSDLCQERYQVREKKTSKKKPRGLKAMGSVESDSERD
ncbi:hypothetical protein ERO13_D03G146500v2 [Gossypium hirsutum]|uniref:Uncharacterized protein n=3 Tax=Gossypium TaxID=3633 RepID=A0A1U8LG41_GOSHI|nr:uncharacterized protein LOC107927101 [Gossypium hirsutum]KAB2038823.1 hypothetical protein ES319_D03G170300v1 [Gossypium barbadense]KAG4156012.1 hypothetical protein ERO13_D03G146500v2 [Gossypium hirsutum]TYG77285.1 hypothetical protein ES288_D03G182300v1 [Gossypium darwinii]